MDIIQAYNKIFRKFNSEILIAKLEEDPDFEGHLYIAIFPVLIFIRDSELLFKISDFYIQFELYLFELTISNYSDITLRYFDIRKNDFIFVGMETKSKTFYLFKDLVYRFLLALKF